MTLGEYVKKRNGVAMGSSKSLRNNLYRSFGAKNFATFWNYWNPIFGYYLGTKVFKPLKTYFSTSISLLITFVSCGLLHDFVTVALRGNTSLFFSVWFFIMGVAVLLSNYLAQDLSDKTWIVRALSNGLIIGSTFGFTMFLQSVLKLNIELF